MPGIRCWITRLDGIKIDAIWDTQLINSVPLLISPAEVVISWLRRITIKDVPRAVIRRGRTFSFKLRYMYAYV